MAAGEQRGDFRDYLRLTRSAGGPAKPAGTAPSLVIWPETAVPFLLADLPDALAAIGDALPDGTRLIVGSPRLETTRDASGGLIAERIYNSLFVVDDDGAISATYDKIHLVPFGEFLPFQDFMESLGIMQLTGIRGGFSRGTGPRLVEVPGAPVAGPLICYEIIFPDEIVEAGRRPGWLHQSDQRRLVRHERGTLSAFLSGALPGHRAGSAGRAGGKYRDLRHHRSSRTHSRRARSRRGRSSRRHAAGRAPGHALRALGKMDRACDAPLRTCRLGRDTAPSLRRKPLVLIGFIGAAATMMHGTLLDGGAGRTYERQVAKRHIRSVCGRGSAMHHSTKTS